MVPVVMTMMMRMMTMTTTTTTTKAGHFGFSWSCKWLPDCGEFVHLQVSGTQYAAHHISCPNTWTPFFL
jgi:hypothetical protein